MTKGAALGDLTGALLGIATHELFGITPTNLNGTDNYVGLIASKWDPSTPLQPDLCLMLCCMIQ